MEQIKNQYYPNNKEFTEVSIHFIGCRTNLTNLKYYLSLLLFNKKLRIKSLDYIVENIFLSYGNFFRYHVRTVLNETKKINNINLICNELIRYSLKTNTIPLIEFITYEKQTISFTLKDYLQANNMKLEDVQIKTIIEKEKQLVR